MKYRVDYDNPLNMGETLFDLAQFYIKRGDLVMAIENLQTALTYFKLVPAEQKIAEVEKLIVTFLYLETEETTPATEQFQTAIVQFQKVPPKAKIGAVKQVLVLTSVVR